MAKTWTVGSFTADAAGNIVGPRDYMEDPDGYAACMARIEAGNDAVFNYGAQSRPGAATVELVLVAVQTHYAGWVGLRSSLAGLRSVSS